MLLNKEYTTPIQNHGKLKSTNRLITYARYKHEFAFESYLDFITEKKYKIVLTRIRLSSHELYIERGRYENLPRDERICKCCNMSQIESEYHFLLVCPLYSELRRKFFKPYFCHWPNLNKFDQLMLSNSKQVTLSIAKFIFSAQELRKSVLNPLQINNWKYKIFHLLLLCKQRLQLY